MIYIKHIQYPAGQGGVHLGIINDHAYIYDCGGFGVNQYQWNKIFTNIHTQLSRCTSLDIFISHYHQDHYNKLSALLKHIAPLHLKIKIYLPDMDNITKILTICDFMTKQKKAYSNPKIQQFINDVFNDLGLREYQNIYEIIHLSPNIEYSESYNGIIIRSYTTNTSPKDISTFKSNAIHIGINLDDAHNQIQKNPYKFWKDIKAVFKNTFDKNYNSNQTMVCLYCGIMRKSYLQNHSYTSWLHTGDAYMKEKNDLMKFYQHFTYLLKYVNFVQIPHHASSNNHGKNFALFFGICHPCIFYYTHSNQKRNIKTKTNDIILFPCQSIHAVTDNYSTMIKT